MRSGRHACRHTRKTCTLLGIDEQSMPLIAAQRAGWFHANTFDFSRNAPLVLGPPSAYPAAADWEQAIDGGRRPPISSHG